ncbi:MULTISPECIES: hypothetical protein [unclassified Rhizobium]|uniref:hypothetical protein n=1 Tax=unclassified Rhizobium TaxID=2613769 RepID=UPI001AD95AC6|nr:MULTISPECIES: hypothetical protein [unclassified Rhizobium]MBO9100556.1 hypothetical protein [Rhizobium sp. L58/93]MBO9136082.1 hypothetical protein [Rhizobium sp. B209b/85]MBO9171393.1 hypothetical protein [Rhizobium sp. L245/93]MBO9187260.1 hypothetical protein [Rhizobium sp. E27B/91]QXZ88139.1 hypothetical protein J5287_30150 [Rhizobium sp. K1/93]
MTTILPNENREIDSDTLKELASIARLITYARESAKGMNAEFPVWCLDLALGAVLQEMYAARDPQSLMGEMDDDVCAMAQRH